MTSTTLPADWASVPLADLAAPEPNSITDGPFGSRLKTEHYTDTGPRVVRLQNIGDGVFLDERAHISESHFATLQKHRVFPGDLLIAALGETLPRACIVPNALGPAIVKADCIRFKPETGLVSNKYLLHALTSPQVRHAAATIIHGVGRPRLNQSEIKSLPIPLAPRAEQDRIVGEIERQFTRLDAGVDSQRRLQVHLRRYRAAVLDRATRGCELVRLRDLLREPLCNGKSVKGSDKPPGIPALRLNAMTSDGFNYSCIRYIPLAWPDVEDIIVADGDFFVSRANGTLSLVGRGTLAQPPPQRMVFPDTMIRVRLRSEVQKTRWIPTTWACQVIRKQIESKAKTTAGIWKISQGDLASVWIPMPPEARQRELMAWVSDAFAGATQNEAFVDRALVRAARLRTAILRAAFEGRLASRAVA